MAENGAHSKIRSDPHDNNYALSEKLAVFHENAAITLWLSPLQLKNASVVRKRVQLTTIIESLLPRCHGGPGK